MAIYNELKEIILEKIKSGEDPLDVIIGQEYTKRQLLSSLLAGRNVVIVGPPGTGKTTIAKTIAKLLPPIKFPKDVPFWAYPEFPFTPEEYKEKWKTGPFIELKGEQRFIRVQGSYDLSIEDLIGDIDPAKAMKYGITSIKSFIPGKIFRVHKGILFFDELNRAPPKVQNILLQLLEEKRITIGAYELEIPIDTIVIATMNPEDYSGVEKLSDVLLDRFDFIYMNYPESIENEIKIVTQKGRRFLDFPEELIRLFIEFITNLRKDEKLDKKPSVRTSIGIFEKAQTLALLDNKKSVELQHVYEAILSILPHRIRLKPSAKLETSEKRYIIHKWEAFLRSKNLDFFQTNPLDKREGFFREDQNVTEKPEEIFEKAIKKGMFIIDKDLIWKEFEENIDLISKITGIPSEEIKWRKDSKFRKNLKERLGKNIKKLKRGGYLNKDGTPSEKLISKFSSNIIARIEKELFGIYEAGKYLSSIYGKDEEFFTKNYSFGDKYNEINPKLSVRNFVKGKSDYFVVEKRREKKGGHYVVLLDCSGSMYGEKTFEAKKALIALTNKILEEGNKLSIILYNDRILRKIFHVDNLSEILRDIFSIQPHSSTNMALALLESKAVLETNKSHVLIITDALPTYGENPIEETLDAVKILKDNGTTISIVGIKLNGEGEKNAKKIVEIGNGNVFIAKDLKDITKFVILDYYISNY